MAGITRLAATALALAAAGAFIACAAQAGQPASSPAPTSITALPSPVPEGEIVAVGSVLDDGDGPELCAGLLESYPPQGGGPVLAGWDWSAVASEEASGVQWSDPVRVQGTFDGTTVTLTEEPSEPGQDADATTPEETGTADQATIDRVLADLDGLDRDDVLSRGPGEGLVQLGVRYDDGSMQGFLDALYGDGVVIVDSWMQDA